ncbi:retinol dehydrogenase 11-like [Amphiura filiformis]|uniref:retinol dehydrogenase 11-like n=1 Tax=Amphiura filiformis TaxID=82378 RepID=UPI003B222F61
MGGKLSYPHTEVSEDRTYLITGGNTGIGYQTAKSIAKLGGRVVIACRSEEKAKEAVEKMQKEHQEEKKKEEKKEEPEEPEEPIAPLNVEFMILDLASFESTMKFIEAYKAKGYPLHVLICNAGFGAGPKETSADGYEMHFQVNYLSHFLMTLHLLPLLRQSAPNSRIVNVSSTVHTHGVFNLENVNGEQSYDRLKFYGNSKMYQIMNMYAFERRLKDTGISVFSVHPGYVDSEFNRGTADNKLMSFMDSLAGTLRMKRNVQDGAMTTLVAALDTAHDGKSAIYFKSCKPSNASALSRKLEHQEALWKFSVDLLKEKGHLTDELLTDLTLPEPEPTGENKPEGEAKEEDAAAATAGGDAAEGEKKTEEAKEEKKEEGGGDASEKKEAVKEEAKEEAKEEPPKEEEKKEEAKEEENKEEEKKE